MAKTQKRIPTTIRTAINKECKGRHYDRPLVESRTFMNILGYALRELNMKIVKCDGSELFEEHPEAS